MSLADRVRGHDDRSLQSDVHLAGWATQVDQEVAPKGETLTRVVMPHQVPQLSLFSFWTRTPEPPFWGSCNRSDRACSSEDAKKPGVGILPLQHSGYNAGGAALGKFTLPMRAFKSAVRVVGRDDQDGGLGDWLLDPDSAGDIIGGFFWPNTGLREIPAWAYAWPTGTVESSAGTPTG